MKTCRWIACLAALSSSPAVARQTDLQQDGFLGKVRENTQITYRRVPGGGIKELNRSRRVYDRDGRMVTAEYREADGSRFVRLERRYDSAGKVVEEATTIGNSTRVSRFTYASNGDAAQILGTDENGKPSRRTIEKPDGVGKISETSRFDRDGRLVGKAVERYDADGNLLERTSSKPDGSASAKEVYAYDAKGRQIQRQTDGLDRRIRVDASGRETEVDVYDAAGALKAKNVLEYDRAGRRIGLSVYDPDGSLRLRTLYKLDGAGNILETFAWGYVTSVSTYTYYE